MSSYNQIVEDCVSKLGKIKIVPVLAIESVEDGIKMCEILNDNNLKAAEITFRTDAAEEIIRQASKKFPEMVIGAGTVLNKEDLHRAFNAGAKFAVAPGFNPTVVKEAVANNYPFFPGIANPSQFEQAYELGVRMFKFFPAEQAGGVPFLKSLLAPYKHLGIKIMPTGGLNTTNIGDYLSISEVPAAGGTWLGKSTDIEAGNWDEITKLVQNAVKLAEKF
ncbi:bifunctional 4-hydroxy-2-oxoglutarate aldolase/2-dehydro-3-deoxy-phosphogluconate aldolase [Lentisphaerota bacterium WC36G]|nr:bifunctional 4-hydroxy-2-oxoglutarate aldolase/2-dehydro-3-deoxy-phosphogluconate aldolase [Lentisphaerae bacterium WC36]